MTTIRKKVITIETRHRTVIRYGADRPQKSACDFCRAEIVTATPAQAAVIFDIGLREIYKGIETGRLHFIEGRGSTPQICLNSLQAYKAQENKAWNCKPK